MLIHRETSLGNSEKVTAVSTYLFVYISALKDFWVESHLKLQYNSKALIFKVLLI